MKLVVSSRMCMRFVYLHDYTYLLCMQYECIYLYNWFMGRETGNYIECVWLYLRTAYIYIVQYNCINNRCIYAIHESEFREQMRYGSNMDKFTNALSLIVYPLASVDS